MDERILDIDGWMHEIELRWLYDTARKVPAGELVVEIGAWMGRSSAAIYEGCAGKNPVVSIDTWQGSPDEPHEIAQQVDLLGVYLENMRTLGFEPKPFPPGLGMSLPSEPHYLVLDSLEALTLIPDNSVCWWFYDGRHTTTQENIAAWMRKMKPGLVTGHDYFCFYDYIQPAVHRLLKHINQIVHSIWVKYWKTEPAETPPHWY